MNNNKEIEGAGMTVLKDLYYGNLHFNDRCFARSSRYGELSEIVSDSEEKLMAFLNALGRTPWVVHRNSCSICPN